MVYQNPIIRGMYPDPSVCCKDGVYYLVNSTFEYFPGVPIFASADLINWTQIGNCLSRSSQVDLLDTECSGGIFAPAIRFHEGRFYMITTCAGAKGMKNFFVMAEDPAGEWSDPIFLDFEGIDPSFYWENGRTYIQYAGRCKIFQVEIDEKTGEILKGPVLLTTGCGGRDAEGPHMWKRGDYYYLMLAEGGTREGHMETLMRGRDLWGPFEPSPYNPILTNRESAKEGIQCVGHADWIQGPDGKDYLAALGTRPIKHQTLLGRETVLTPAKWTEDGWLVAETGHMPEYWQGTVATEQKMQGSFEMDLTVEKMPLYIISPRNAHPECYKFENHKLKIRGTKETLSEGRGAFWGIRQSEFEFSFTVRISPQVWEEQDEAGIAVRSSDDYHFSMFVSVRDGKKAVVLRKKAADLETETIYYPETEEEGQAMELQVKGNKEKYCFYCDNEELGWSYTRHLTIQNAGTPNTGVVLGVFAVGNAKGEISRLRYEV